MQSDIVPRDEATICDRLRAVQIESTTSPEIKPSQKQTIQPFSFLKLPLELRYAIYDYSIPNKVKISQLQPSSNGSCHPWALAYVCRTIRHEFLSALYSQARFIIDLPDRYRSWYGVETQDAHKDWIADLDPELAAQIKHLEIRTIIGNERAIKWEAPSDASGPGGFFGEKKLTWLQLTVAFKRVVGRFEVSRVIREDRQKKPLTRSLKACGPWLPRQSREIAYDIGNTLGWFQTKINERKGETVVGLGKESIKLLLESLTSSSDTKDERVVSKDVHYLQGADA
ncbi:MAG: hypothetical protein LQ338_006375 [Usnochroma carphineum]|nr:MAG: hypothetical protein LQ338_006375 [Usnochroma carphineum]